ncbi:hypothetical protein PSAC2689_40403 [Paraburkholderia sacchari]
MCPVRKTPSCGAYNGPSFFALRRARFPCVPACERGAAVSSRRWFLALAPDFGPPPARLVARNVHPDPNPFDLNLCVFFPPASNPPSFLPPLSATSRSAPCCPPRSSRARARSRRCRRPR